IQRDPPDLDALRAEADGIEGRRRTLQTERSAAESRDGDGLAEEIKALQAERTAYLRELAEVLQPKQDKL
ncbi:hypothetical protein, partial [Klebsiella pneumoniae]